MYDEINEQMSRYPVFSYHDINYIDESELFKDEDIQKQSRKNVFQSQHSQSQKKKNQTIVNIYDKINHNNANDPLHPKNLRISQQYRMKHYSTITSARNSKIDKSNRSLMPDQGRHEKSLNKFVGEITNTLTNEEAQKNDNYKFQKISLLKRIIEHYNLKSVEKKYYSNLIKSFGLKIESINSEDVVTKKNFQTRKLQKLNEITEPCEELKFPSFQDQLKCLKGEKPKRNTFSRRFKQSLSLMNPQPFTHSSQDIVGSQKKNEQKKEEKKGNSQKMRKTMESSQKLVQKPLRLQSSSTNIEAKIIKYRQFLFILNYSNHLYRELDFHRYEQTFKYYVGKGNNRNLIKSLMKKRFWFQETKKIEEAHFVWTQIKVNQLFEHQKISKTKVKKQIVNQMQEIKEVKSQTQRQQKVSESRKEEKKTHIKSIKFSKNQINAKSFEPLDPALKIITSKQHKDLKELEESLGIRKNIQFSKKIKFSKRRLTIQESETLIHNHFPLNGLLGNKKAMYYNMKEFCRLTENKLSEYVPLTFHIRKGFLDEQYKNFTSIFIERKKQKLPNYWIMKPGQFSNRGQGISCTHKLQQIRKRIIETRNTAKKGQEASLIVQLYLSNPLLYNFRKFDIRVFMMVTSINGKIKGYWYQEGYVRTSSFAWNLSQIEDKYIHLTNDAIQKTCYEYGMYEPGNKLSYSQLQRYLCTLSNSSRNLDFFGVIYPKMRSMAADAIKSVFMNLDPKKLRDNFEIFGLDFMLDSNFKPWLIEVNTNPCLQINCPLLQRIIPHMLENAFRISIDPLFPPPFNVQTDYKYAIPENALHYNKFQLVFDEDRDGQSLEKLYKSSKIMQQLDDIEQDQEQFEQEGEIMDYDI